MNDLKDDFDIPELPGDDLLVMFAIDHITFSGIGIGREVTADPENVVYVEDWC